MPGGPGQGERGEETHRVAPRRMPRVAGVCVMLLVVGAMALGGYDHRQIDMSRGWTALPDG
ncbi:MAG: hypothetical protein M3Z46_08625, partial [Actinomycetota bacterium]|nr:hypothetical protein [Actinomycetota bacterium]